MNQRIRELAEQAISDVDYIRDDDFTNEELSQMYIPDCFAEKFAELIVRECVQVCNDVDAEYKGEDVLATWCARAIEEHFGVKE